MMKTAQSDAVELAREKQRLIAEFLRLTEAQAGQIEADHYDSILMLISRKQSIIEQVNRLDRQGADSGGEGGRELARIASDTQALLSRAQAIEDRNIAAIRQNQAQIFAQLKKAQVNQTTHAAYRGRHASMEGILVDRKK